MSLGASAQTLPKFMGREVKVIKPEREDDFFPKGPASVCIEAPPQQQCYTAPKEFGNSPTVALVQLDKDTPALFFSAASGGISGWQVHFALLRPATGKDLWDSFPDVSVSNQNQYAFWNEASISAAPIFVTADVAWESDQAHYGEHRYIISAYTRTPPSYDDDIYLLEDRYMTVRRYDLGAHADALASEKQEILARLRRVKAASQSQH
jgi:hypothetical protein